MNKLQYQFVLIDDSDLDLLINNRLLSISGLATSVNSFSSCRAALDYIIGQGSELKHTIVIVDLQIPGMSGFDFLDAFCELDEEIRSKVNIFMLSSTAAQRDIDRAARHACLTGRLSKPLDIDILKQKLLSL